MIEKIKNIFKDKYKLVDSFPVRNLVDKDHKYATIFIIQQIELELLRVYNEVVNSDTPAEGKE